MKTSDLSIKELAAFIGVSTDTIRRAARTGEIPSTRVGTAYRFDLHQVLHQMERKAAAYQQEGIDGRAGRREPVVRRVKRPRIGNTGALPTGMITGGLILVRFQDETNCGRVLAWHDHAGLIHSS